MILTIQEGKSIKKTINIVIVIISLMLLVVASAYLVLQSRAVQTMIISTVTGSISRATGADVKIKKVKLTFLRKVVFEDVYISDQNKDTLLFAEDFSLDIDSLQLRKKNLKLSSLKIGHPKIFVQRIDSSNFNFSFLFSGGKGTSDPWKISCKKIAIEDGEFSFSDDNISENLNKFLKFRDIDLDLKNIRFVSANNFSGSLDQLVFKSNNGFILKELNSEFQYSDSVVTLRNIEALSEYSSLKADSLMLGLKNFLKKDDFSELAVNLKLNHLLISFYDAGYFYDDIKGEGPDIKLAGSLSGRINDLKGKNIVATIGEITRATGDFYLNGLPDIKNTYIFLNLNESFANLNEIRKQEFPARFEKIKDKIPQFLDKVGIFTYTGNFTGFINDFVAYGTVNTNLGLLKSDISFKPLENKALKIEGHLKTNVLDIGTLLDVKNIGTLTLSGNVDGTLKGNKYDLVINGLIDSIDINDYCFHNVVLNGNIRNKLFDGMLTVNDPNLKLDYSGRLDLSPELPVFEFVADVRDASLSKLNLLKDTASVVSFGLDANFVGNNIDNLKGQIKVKDLKYKNFRDSLKLANAVINNISSNDTSYISVKSDWIEGELEGSYRFLDIINSFSSYYTYYLPSSTTAKNKEFQETNDFKFNFRIKEADPFCKVFMPKLSFATPFDVTGYYKPLLKMAFLETFLPSAGFQDQRLGNVRLKVEGSPEKLICNINSDRLVLGKDINIYNFSIQSDSKNDKVDAGIFWNNYSENTYSGAIKSEIEFVKTENKNPTVIVNIDPSKIYYADSLWIIEKTSVRIDSSTIKFDDLSLHSLTQSFVIDGAISEDKQSTLSARIRNADFGLFSSLIGNTNLKGEINGIAKVRDIYDKMIIGMDVRVGGFALGKTYFGDALLKCEWNNEREKLATNITFTNKNQKIVDASGDIDIFNKNLDLDLVLDKSPTDLLGTLLPSLFYNVQGTVSGQVEMTGSFSDIQFNGSLKPDQQVGLGVNAIKVNYFFSDPVIFHNDSLVFRMIEINDEFGNKGMLDGYLTHTNLSSNVGYNLTINTDKICGMNTTSYDRERFYGTIFGKGTMYITGDGSAPTLNGDFVTEKGSTIYIPVGGSSKAEQYDFIQFTSDVKKVDVGDKEYVPRTTGLKMNFDVEVTPDAKVQIIFNSQIGDVLKAEGAGNIQVRMDKNFNLELYGNYEIEKGDYLFTLQNVINKRFYIEKGGTIKWMGNPYDGLVDVKALYRVKTSLHDLFLGSSTEVDKVRRLPVDCIIYLTDNLSRPAIDFKIDLPTAEERIKEEVDQLIVTKEDINKQIISLLMIGRFYTPDFFAGKPGTNTGVELMGATASELLSNQLSNWMSQILKDWDFGINYRPGNLISNDQIEVALSTQVLNDRITIGTNIANNTNQTVNNSAEIVGDFDMNIKLTDNGKLQFKAYHHSNDNLINDTSPYTQGVGFTYREEFNSLKELIQMYKDAILNKKKKVNTSEEVKNEI